MILTDAGTNRQKVKEGRNKILKQYALFFLIAILQVSLLFKALWVISRHSLFLSHLHHICVAQDSACPQNQFFTNCFSHLLDSPSFKINLYHWSWNFSRLRISNGCAWHCSYHTQYCLQSRSCCLPHVNFSG